MQQISFIFSSKFKHACSILLLIIMIFFGITFLQKATMRDSSGFKYRPFLQEYTEYDVLFFGTSHVINGIFPMQLWNDYGITSYNFGGHANSLAMAYWTMINAVEYHKPKVAVLDVLGAGSASTRMDIGYAHLSMDAFPLTETKIAAIRDIYPDDKEQQTELIFPLSIYHNRWNEMNSSMLKAGAGIYSSSSKEKGAESRIQVGIPNDMELISETDMINQQTVGLDYIQKFITFCNENDIIPVIINIPYPADIESQQAANAAIKLAKTNHVGAINFQYLDLVDFNIDCYDPDSHLNPSGARKVTDYLGKYLTSHYDLTDHRDDATYADWKDDYDDYYDYLVYNIKSHDDFKETLMLLNNENFKGVLEATSDYRPDDVEKKLSAQLGSNLKLRRVSSVTTSGGQQGTVKLTVLNAQTEEEIISKVYRESDTFSLLKDDAK